MNLQRTRPRIRAAFYVVAVQAALGGDGDDSAAHLDSCGLAANRERAFERTGLGIAAFDGGGVFEDSNDAVCMG